MNNIDSKKQQFLLHRFGNVLLIAYKYKVLHI